MTIIDCGSNSSPLGSPARLLADELSVGDLRSLSSLVVTHYDGDHWRGLKRFALKHWPAGEVPTADPLPLYSPAVPFGLPSDLPASVMALISATSERAVEALDLEAAWKTRFPTKIVPCAAGDWIDIAGRDLEVVWPPREFTGPNTEKAAAIVGRIEDLAEKLDERGYPELRKALQVAYRHKTSARKLQNDLSLVFHDPAMNSLLVYGDATESVVGHLIGRLGRTYQVVLAPHHGTHEMPAGASRGIHCVAQGGARGYYRDWRTKHRRTHLSGGCVHLTNWGGSPARLLMS